MQNNEYVLVLCKSGTEILQDLLHTFNVWGLYAYSMLHNL